MPAKNIYTDALTHPIFEYISEAATNLQIETYVIGGFVRDYFLKRDIPKDIDIVAVGSGIELAKAVAELLPRKPKVQVFKTYGTAMLGMKILKLNLLVHVRNHMQKIAGIRLLRMGVWKMIKTDEISPSML